MAARLIAGDGMTARKILVAFAHPLADLSRGAMTDEVFDTAVVTLAMIRR